MKTLLTIVLAFLCFVSKAQKTKVIVKKMHQENTPVSLQDTILYEHVAHILPHQTFILPYNAYVFKTETDKPTGYYWVETRTGKKYNENNSKQLKLIFPDTAYYISASGVQTKIVKKWFDIHPTTDVKVTSDNATFDLYYLTFYKCKDGEQGDEFPKDNSIVTIMDTQLYVHHIYLDSGYMVELPKNSYLNQLVAKPSEGKGAVLAQIAYANGKISGGPISTVMHFFTEDSQNDGTFNWSAGSNICVSVKTVHGSINVYYLTFAPATDKPKIAKLE